jgi:predicted ATPase
MKYRESSIDKQLRKRFANDNTHALLRRVRLGEGALRGINSLDITFEYPITAIAGRNGAGKSTILALVSCAYHNHKSGFKLQKRKNSYYTFSDFFIQHADEVSPDGINIEYYIAHNNWKKTAGLPDGVGIGYQHRRKNKGGKWNDYDGRVKRNVVFLGIERIVPHIERSQARSYAKAFINSKAKGWENKVKDAVGFVLGRTYEEFRYAEYSKYSLPIVCVKGNVYSGFNMGAGENALFEIFSTLYSCGAGALLVMDEVELGLHAEAQRRFIDRLKLVCLELHTQVICTTHSREIFDCLPYDARFYIENINGKTKITEGISSEFAFAKLAAIPGTEMEVLVEDEVARTILSACIPTAIRSRLAIHVIGSATALSRQLAALYVHKSKNTTLAVFDGDQKSQRKINFDHAKSMSENIKDDFPVWFESHINYLPGDSWPEAWLVQKSFDCLEPLAASLSSDPDSLKDILDYGQQAGKHNEFFEISKHLGMQREACIHTFAMVVGSYFSDEFKDLVAHIERKLSEAG